MTPLSGVLFDAGGTLVQLHTDRLAAELRLRGCDPTRLDEAFWETLALLDEEFGPQAGEWDEWFPQWLARMASGCSVSPAAMAEAWEAADKHAILWDRPVPGAAECLAQLRAAGLAVGVVSNSDGRMTEALTRAGLAEFLDVIVDSGSVGVAKPDPAIFEHALAPLGLTPDETWYLGDTIAYDAAAAEAAGLTSWVIDHGGVRRIPERHGRVVDSFTEFTAHALAAADGGFAAGRSLRSQ